MKTNDSVETSIFKWMIMTTLEPLLVILKVVGWCVVAFVAYRIFIGYVKDEAWNKLNHIYDKAEPWLAWTYGDKSISNQAPKPQKPKSPLSSILMQEDKGALREHFLGMERVINDTKREYRTLRALSDMTELRLRTFRSMLGDSQLFEKAHQFIEEFTQYHKTFKNATLQAKNYLKYWIQLRNDSKSKMNRQCSSASVCESLEEYGLGAYVFLRSMNGTMNNVKSKLLTYGESYNNALVLAREMSVKNDLVSIDYEKIAKAIEDGWEPRKIISHYGFFWALGYIPGAYGFGPTSSAAFGVSISTMLYKALGHLYTRMTDKKNLVKVEQIRGWLRLVDILTLSHQDFYEQKLKLTSEFKDHIVLVQQQIHQAIVDTPLGTTFNASSIFWGFVRNIDQSMNEAHESTMRVKKNAKLLYQLQQIRSELVQLDQNDPISRANQLQNPSDILLLNTMDSDDLDGDDVFDDNELDNDQDGDTSSPRSKIPDRLHMAMEAASGVMQNTF